MRYKLLTSALFCTLLFAQQKPAPTQTKQPEGKQLSSDDRLAIREAQLGLLQAQMQYNAAQQRVQQTVEAIEKKNGCKVTPELTCTAASSNPSH